MLKGLSSKLEHLEEYKTLLNVQNWRENEIQRRRDEEQTNNVLRSKEDVHSLILQENNQTAEVDGCSIQFLKIQTGEEIKQQNAHSQKKALNERIRNVSDSLVSMIGSLSENKLKQVDEIFDKIEEFQINQCKAKETAIGSINEDPTKSKKKRGRPPKAKDALRMIKSGEEEKPKEKIVGKKRGRPRKVVQTEDEFVPEKKVVQKSKKVVVPPTNDCPETDQKPLKVKLVGRRVGRPSKKEMEILRLEQNEQSSSSITSSDENEKQLKQQRVAKTRETHSDSDSSSGQDLYKYEKNLPSKRQNTMTAKMSFPQNS